MTLKKRFIPIEIGTSFGDLEVVGEAIKKVTKSLEEKNTFRAFFPCKCKCGKELFVTGSQLRSGKRTRCSDCAYKERPQSTRRIPELERLYNLTIISRVKESKNRIRNFLTLEEFKEIVLKNCF